MLSQFLLSQVFAFLMIFCRTGSAIMLLPGFSETYVPARVRLLLALFFSLVLVPIITMPAIPNDVPHLFILILAEIMTGVFLGGLSYLLISTLQIASSIIAYQAGLSAALTLGLGQSQGQQTALDNLLSYSAVVLLFGCNLHHLMLKGLADSYTLFLPGQFPSVGDFANHATHMMSMAFQTAMQLAAPSLVVGLMLNLGSGILSRLMPNFQIFFIMMAPQLVLGFLVLMFSMSAIMLWYMDYIKTTLATFLTPG